MGGIDLAPHIAAAMNASGIVVLQTSFASVHTDTHRIARSNGARILDMWGWEEETMVVGGALADYGEVARITERVTEALSKAKTGRFTTPEGSDMTFSLEGRTSNSLIGVARDLGEFTACPDGESAISPIEGSASGVMANPFSIERKDPGFVTEPIRIEVAGGQPPPPSPLAAVGRYRRPRKKHCRVCRRYQPRLPQAVHHARGQEILRHLPYGRGRQPEHWRRHQRPHTRGHGLRQPHRLGRRRNHFERW